MARRQAGHAQRGAEKTDPQAPGTTAQENAGTDIIIPARAQEVEFYGDAIPVAALPGGEPYVAVRPISDHLGLDPAGQRRRIQRDAVMAPRLRTLLITAADRRQRELLCMPLEMLPGYLFGIDTGRVRADLVDKVNRYRADCFRVLWEAFRGEAWSVTPAVPPGTTSVQEHEGPRGDVPVTPARAETVPGLAGAALALEIATALQHMARQQLDMEQRIADVAGRHEVMADYLRGFIGETNRRLVSLEQRAREDTVDDGQAAEIALAVKAVGQALVAAGERAGYAQVYSEIYRRYSISSYRKLPARLYAEVMAWLHRWYGEVAGTGKG